MKRINRYVLTVFSTAAFLLSCSEDVNINLESQGDPIQFEFTANDNIDVITRNDNGMPSVATTRGTVITAFASTKSIKLYAYDHSGAFASSNDPGTYGFNAAYEGGDASTLNITESTKYWPYDQTSSGNRKLSFFAFYPSDCGTYASTSGYPTHEYTVSTTVANQTDLLVAKAVNQTVANRNGAGKLPITFNHALSAVIFSIGANFGAKNGSVTITIKNVYNHGLYNYGTGTWTPKPETPTTTNYSVTLSGITASATDVSTLSGNDEKAGKVLFLLPQTIPNNATLEISYTDGGNVTHTFSKQLKTISSITTWLPGHTYHYTISAASVGAMSATLSGSSEISS